MSQTKDIQTLIFKSLYDNADDTTRLNRLEDHISYSAALHLDHQLEILEKIKNEIQEA